MDRGQPRLLGGDEALEFLEPVLDEHQTWPSGAIRPYLTAGLFADYGGDCSPNRSCAQVNPAHLSLLRKGDTHGGVSPRFRIGCQRK